MTAQSTETIVIDGQDHALCSLPLQPWLDTVRPPLEFVAELTSLWRGYIGTWALRDGRLYLIGIRGRLRLRGPAGARDAPPRAATLSDLFPDAPADGVLADWFSGELRVVRGPLVRYVHGGFLSQFETEQFLTVQAGMVTGERLVHHPALAPGEDR